MAELKASELKYGVPLSTKLGGLLFTATNIETPANAEYAPEGALYLNLEKLGLADNAPAGAASVAGETTVGETASTTALPIYAWCTPLMTAKTAGEGAKQVLVAYTAAVTQIEGKLCLRIFAQNVAGLKEPLLEPKTSTKAPISLCTTTVFCLGK
jgi:hypothetical protein